MDMTRRVEDLIFLIEQLSLTLEGENTALRDNDYKTVSSYFEKKDSLSRAYESRMKALVGETGQQALEEVSLEQKTGLRKVGETLAILIEENTILLEATVEANRRVIDLIADAVKSLEPGPGTYSGKGSLSRPDHYAAPKNMSISLNQVL